MLKFIKHHMTSILDIEIYPIISFLIFFSFFIMLMLYVITLKKSEIEELESIPLNNENDEML